MAAGSGAPFAGMANAARLHKFVLMSAQMMLIGAGLSGCAVPLREGFGSQEGLISPDHRAMLASAQDAAVQRQSQSTTCMVEFKRGNEGKRCVMGG